MSASRPDDQPIRDRLRAAGLRVTAGRVAVYSHLLEASSPLRHGDLVGALGHLHLDQATVYRNLIDLTQAGLVQRTDIGDHSWRFEAVENAGGAGHGGAHHPHFVCTVCGDVKCLDDIEVSFSDHNGQVHALGKRPVEVQVRGTCDNCA